MTFHEFFKPYFVKLEIQIFLPAIARLCSLALTQLGLTSRVSVAEKTERTRKNFFGVLIKGLGLTK